MSDVPVRITRLAVAHPPQSVTQSDAATAIAQYASEPRRVGALARGTQIERRSLVLPPYEIVALGTAGARNDIYRKLAPGLAASAVSTVLGEYDPRSVQCLVTSSCTGYMVPSWGVGLVQQFGLKSSVARLPITEAGCAGGVVGLARAVDYLRAHACAGAALVASVELCSLAFHAGGDDGNLTSTLIFGDGAGAALLEAGPGPGLEVIDTMSMLVPGTEAALGFDLTDQGFRPILSRELAALLEAPTQLAVTQLLSRSELVREDIDAWLIHPGGARILAGVQESLGIARAQLRWSWDAMREHGNTSSAAIFDVMDRYFPERVPGEYSVAIAFGPGLAIELLLLRAS